MKRLILGLLVGVTCVGCGSPEHSAATKERVLASELGGPCEVIGRLGVPLGKAVVIEGEIVAEVDETSKVGESHYVLRVRSIAGQPLPRPVQMDFECHPCSTWQCKKQIGPFATSAVIQDEGAKRLSKDEIRRFNEERTGRALRLLAYETGCFGGIPNNLTPNDMPSWQDFGWHFSTWLIALDVK